MEAEKAPPPTPIATGKGTWTAAVNDGDLGKYLERSLKIPDLTLPNPFPCSLRLLHHKIPSGIDLQSLRAGDETAVRLLLAAAAGTGAFRIDGHGLELEEVRLVVELAATRGGGGVVEVEEEVGRWVGKKEGGVREELCWSGPVEDGDAAVAGKAPVTETYQVLREKLEKLSMQLETIAGTVNQVIHTHIKNPSQTKIVTVPEGYLLFLKKHDLHHRGNHDDEQKKTDQDYPSHSLSLHLSPECREFRLQSKECSTSYSVPGGSLIVTIGRQLQEWSNGELKGVNGEPVFDRLHDPSPCFSLEFMCSPRLPRRRGLIPPAKHFISVTDQVLIVLALSFLFSSWVFDFSEFTKS